MKVLPTFKRSSQGITLIALLGLVSFSTLIQMNSKKTGQLRLFQEGVQTCFSRVAQSFTARTIGDTSSPYIGSEFKGFTEECFGEVQLAFENIESNKASEILTQTNKINQEVYELHKKINSTAPLNTPENVLLANIGSRFEKLEIKRDKVLELVDQSLTSLVSARSSLKIFFYFFSAVTPVLILLTLMRNIKKEGLFRKIENEAREILVSDNFQVTKTESLISSTLKEYDLLNVKDLFEAYRTRTNEKGVDVTGKSTFLNPSKDIESQIKEVWTQSPATADKNEVICNLEESVNFVLDGLTEKLIVMGIKVDINLKKSLVKMAKEDVDQILYHSISALMNEYDRTAESRTLRMYLKNENTSSQLNIVFTGSCLDQSIVDQFQKTGKLKDKVELSICQQLLADNNGSLAISNRESPVGNTTVLTLNFKRSPQSKLVDIKKTTKKEFFGNIKGMS